VLFVCSGNSERSPTAERLFDNWRGEWKAKSAGTNPVRGGKPVTQALIDWADLILVMQQEHEEYIVSNLRCDGGKLHVLNIDDVYPRYDPELVRELRLKVIPLLEQFTKD
jgi:predicted protein tyrosine phosphatase